MQLQSNTTARTCSGNSLMCITHCALLRSIVYCIHRVLLTVAAICFLVAGDCNTAVASCISTLAALYVSKLWHLAAMPASWCQFTNHQCLFPLQTTSCRAHMPSHPTCIPQSTNRMTLYLLHQHVLLSSKQTVSNEQQTLSRIH